MLTMPTDLQLIDSEIEVDLADSIFRTSKSDLVISEGLVPRLLADPERFRQRSRARRHCRHIILVEEIVDALSFCSSVELEFLKVLWSTQPIPSEDDATRLPAHRINFESKLNR